MSQYYRLKLGSIEWPTVVNAIPYWGYTGKTVAAILPGLLIDIYAPTAPAISILWISVNSQVE